MAHPYHHALSSVKKWGGAVEDYLPIHSWFDASKEILADFRIAPCALTPKESFYWRPCSARR